MKTAEQYEHELDCERARVEVLNGLLADMTAKYNREWNKAQDAMTAAAEGRMELAYEQAARRKAEAERDEARADREVLCTYNERLTTERNAARAEVAALKAERDEARRAPGHNQIQLRELREANERVREQRDSLRAEVGRLKALAREMVGQRNSA